MIGYSNLDEVKWLIPNPIIRIAYEDGKKMGKPKEWKQRKFKRSKDPSWNEPGSTLKHESFSSRNFYFKDIEQDSYDSDEIPNL